MDKKKVISVARAVAFAALGIVFLWTAWQMPPGMSRTVWNIIGGLDLVYAGWIAVRLMQRP